MYVLGVAKNNLLKCSGKHMCLGHMQGAAHYNLILSKIIVIKNCCQERKPNAKGGQFKKLYRKVRSTSIC